MKKFNEESILKVGQVIYISSTDRNWKEIRIYLYNILQREERELQHLYSLNEKFWILVMPLWIMNIFLSLGSKILQSQQATQAFAQKLRKYSLGSIQVIFRESRDAYKFLPAHPNQRTVINSLVCQNKPILRVKTIPKGIIIVFSDQMKACMQSIKSLILRLWNVNKPILFWISVSKITWII